MDLPLYPIKHDTQRRERNQAKRLAEKFGIEIEIEEDLERFYVCHPDFDEDSTPPDPYAGDHFVYTWEAVLERVQGYITALQRKES